MRLQSVRVMGISVNLERSQWLLTGQLNVAIEEIETVNAEVVSVLRIC